MEGDKILKKRTATSKIAKEESFPFKTISLDRKGSDIERKKSKKTGENALIKSKENRINDNQLNIKKNVTETKKVTKDTLKSNTMAAPLPKPLKKTSKPLVSQQVATQENSLNLKNEETFEERAKKVTNNGDRSFDFTEDDKIAFSSLM